MWLVIIHKEDLENSTEEVNKDVAIHKIQPNFCVLLNALRIWFCSDIIYKNVCFVPEKCHVRKKSQNMIRRTKTFQVSGDIRCLKMSLKGIGTASGHQPWGDPYAALLPVGLGLVSSVPTFQWVCLLPAHLL